MATSIRISLIFLISISILTFANGQNKKEFPYAVDLHTVDGEVVNTSSFNDNDADLFILDFWNRGCKPCIVVMNAMAEEFDKITDLNIRIVAVSTFPIDHAARKLMDKYEWPFEIYYDTSGKLFDKLKGMKTSVPLTIAYDKDWNRLLKKRGANVNFVKENGELSDDWKLIKKAYEQGNLDQLVASLDIYYDLLADQ